MKDYIKRIYLGRIGRKNYILGILSLGVLFVLSMLTLWFSAAMISVFGLYAILNGIAVICTIFLYAAYVFYAVSLYVRRFHDLNKSAWHGLFLLIPIINIYWAIVLLFKRGKESENKYGSVNLDAKILATVFKGSSTTSQNVQA